MESGNNKKLSDFFKEEYSSLQSYVRTRVKTGINKEPEDILQDVALKLFSSADKYNPINNVAGFVYHSIRNKIIDVIRSNKKTNFIEERNDALLLELAHTLIDDNGHQYSELEIKHLKDAISSLADMDRDIIIAIDFEGYTYKEISKESGIPEGTLMSRRHRAIGKLGNTLTKKQLIKT